MPESQNVQHSERTKPYLGEEWSGWHVPLPRDPAYFEAKSKDTFVQEVLREGGLPRASKVDSSFVGHVHQLLTNASAETASKQRSPPLNRYGLVAAWCRWPKEYSMSGCPSSTNTAQGTGPIESSFQPPRHTDPRPAMMHNSFSRHPDPRLVNRPGDSQPTADQSSGREGVTTGGDADEVD